MYLILHGKIHNEISLIYHLKYVKYSKRFFQGILFQRNISKFYFIPKKVLVRFRVLILIYFMYLSNIQTFKIFLNLKCFNNIKYFKNILNSNTSIVTYLNCRVRIARILRIFIKVFYSILICFVSMSKIICEFRYNLYFSCNIRYLSLHTVGN